MKKQEATPKKGFKAFDKGLICKGKQYAENTEYKESGEISLCNHGIHYCENPLDVLNYYDLCDSEFAEVEDIGNKTKSDGTKSVTNHLKIKAKLDFKGFIKASFDFLWEKCTKEEKGSGDSSKLAASGDYSQLAASGDYSQLAASGDYSKLAASGDYSKLAASGYSSQLAASGDYSQLAASGDASQLAASGDYSKLAASEDYSQLAASGYYSKLAASGDYSQLAASGDYSQLAASGDYSKLAASGYSSQLAASGKDSICAAIGINSQAKGIKGTWIVLAEYDDRNIVKCVKSAKIDGKKLLEDTYYILKEGKFVKA
jgi:hypothetical protein